MKKLLFFGIFAVTSLGLLSCSSKKESFDGAKTLMQQQIVDLSSVGSVEELMSVQVQNGDTLVSLMTILEPELTIEQKQELQQLNAAYNSRLRSVADSLVQITMVEQFEVVDPAQVPRK